MAKTLAGFTAPTGVTTAACGLPACSDGTDNDGDGLIDFPADPNCPDALHMTETPESGVLRDVLLSGTQDVSAESARVAAVFDCNLAVDDRERIAARALGPSPSTGR